MSPYDIARYYAGHQPSESIEGATAPVESKPPVNHAHRVLEQYRRLEYRTRAWSIALCRTEGGQPFAGAANIVWLFNDRSALFMNDRGMLTDSTYDPVYGIITYLERLDPEFEATHERVFL